MVYKSVETYTFTVSSELDALKRFKDELRASGIPFTETGGAFMTKITITTKGEFDMKEKMEVK